MIIVPILEIGKPRFGGVDWLAQALANVWWSKDTKGRLPSPKLKFFTTVHTAIFTQAIPRKFFPSSSFIINCKFIQTFLWQMLSEFLFYAKEHAKSMNQDYMEQSGSYNGDGRRSSQISRRTYAWVVQSDIEIAKCHSEKWIRRSRRRDHFVFCFPIWVVPRLETKWGNWKEWRIKLYKELNDLDI